MNDINLQIFSSGTTLISDHSLELNNMTGLWYETGYPGGKYLAGGCYIPRVPQDWWEINGPLRVVVRSGQQIVYEGVIPELQHRMSSSNMGVMLNFTGYWAWSMLNRSGRKRWADDRVDEQTWEYQTGYAMADRCTVQRDDRIYFLPKAEAWSSGNSVAVRYTLRGSGDIKRITYDYDFDEGAQSWELSLWRYDGSWVQMDTNAVSGETYNTGTTTIITATGTGSIDVEPNGTITELEFRYYSRAAQTPTSDGTYYAKITNLMVYTEDEGATGIHLDSVATDLINGAYLNTDTSYLNASDNIRKVEPFITANDNYEALGDILMRIAGFGNSSDERYAVGVLASEKAATPDGLPVLYTEEYPDVDAGYDYFISLDDPNISGPVSITRDYNIIANEVTVTYRDEQGWQQIAWSGSGIAGATGLADATSQAEPWGKRWAHLSVGNSDAASAIDYGTRFIQRYKDPQWVINGSIGVLWALEGSSGELIPASRVEAGKRLKIDGYDTFIVSRTRYDADSEVVELTVGNPDTGVFTETVFAPTWNDPVPTSSGTGTTGGGTGDWDNSDFVNMREFKRNNPEEWKKRKADMLRYHRENKGEKHWRKNWARDRGYM